MSRRARSWWRRLRRCVCHPGWVTPSRAGACKSRLTYMASAPGRRGALPCRSPRHNGGHADGRRHALGQRADVNDVPGIVACGDGVAVDADIVGPVVLHHEVPVFTHHVQGLRGRTAGPAGHGDELDAGIPGRQDGPPVARRFDGQGTPAAHRGADDGAQPTLASRQHDHVAGRRRVDAQRRRGPSSRANQDCSSGRPATGGRDSAACTNGSGSSSRSGQPEWRAMAWFGTPRMVDESVTGNGWCGPRPVFSHVGSVAEFLLRARQHHGPAFRSGPPPVA